MRLLNDLNASALLSAIMAVGEYFDNSPGTLKNKKYLETSQKILILYRKAQFATFFIVTFFSAENHVVLVTLLLQPM